MCVMFSCVFVTFPYGCLDQVWNFIALMPDLCLFPTYFLTKGWTIHSKREGKDQDKNMKQTYSLSEFS